MAGGCCGRMPCVACTRAHSGPLPCLWCSCIRPLWHPPGLCSRAIRGFISTSSRIAGWSFLFCLMCWDFSIIVLIMTPIAAFCIHYDRYEYVVTVSRLDGLAGFRNYLCIYHVWLNEIIYSVFHDVQCRHHRLTYGTNERKRCCLQGVCWCIQQSAPTQLCSKHRSSNSLCG